MASAEVVEHISSEIESLSIQKEKEEEKGEEKECSILEEQVVINWRDIPELQVLAKRPGGDTLTDFLERKDYNAFSNCIYMYRQYMIDNFSRIGSEPTMMLLKDEKFLDVMSESIATKICVLAGILPEKDEDVRPYLKMYLQDIDDDESPQEKVGPKAEKLWSMQSDINVNPEDVDLTQDVEMLSTAECLRGIIELLDEGDGFILPDHMKKLSLYMLYISHEDEELFEVCQYLIANNMEQPLPEHLKDKVYLGTEEEREQGRIFGETLTGGYEGETSVLNDTQCVIC